jgi:hypothetical protein
MVQLCWNFVGSIVLDGSPSADSQSVSHEEAGYMTATDTSLTRLYEQSCAGERSIYDPPQAQRLSDALLKIGHRATLLTVRPSLGFYS